MASSTSKDFDEPDEGTDIQESPALECEYAPPPAGRTSFPSTVRWARPVLGLDNFS